MKLALRIRQWTHKKELFRPCKTSSSASSPPAEHYSNKIRRTSLIDPQAPDWIGGHYFYKWYPSVCPSGKHKHTASPKQKHSTTLHGAWWVTNFVRSVLFSTSSHCITTKERCYRAVTDVFRDQTRNSVIVQRWQASLAICLCVRLLTILQIATVGLESRTVANNEIVLCYNDIHCPAKKKSPPSLKNQVLSMKSEV